MSSPQSAEYWEGWFVQRISTALKIPAQEVDISAPFVEHGLDSVSALQMTGELEQLSGRAIPPTLFWEYPTVAALSQYLAR